MAPNEVIRQLADEPVAEPLVEAARSRIEQGDAKKDVGCLPQDPLLRESNEAGAEARPAALRSDAHDLDVAAKRAPHVQHQKPGQGLSRPRDVALLRVVAHQLERRLVPSAEREPGLARAHETRASLRLRETGERKYGHRGLVLSPGFHPSYPPARSVRASTTVTRTPAATTAIQSQPGARGLFEAEDTGAPFSRA